MTNYSEVEYEWFSIRLTDVKHTWIPKKEGMCIVFEGDSHRFVEFLENADQILAGERFRSITSDDREMYECNVCGENGCTIRYNSNFFTLHEECKEQFIEDVRSFLEEHSQTVLSEAI